jgi:hypothetical protein
MSERLVVASVAFWPRSEAGHRPNELAGCEHECELEHNILNRNELL